MGRARLFPMAPWLQEQCACSLQGPPWGQDCQVRMVAELDLLPAPDRLRGSTAEISILGLIESLVSV